MPILNLIRNQIKCYWLKIFNWIQLLWTA